MNELIEFLTSQEIIVVYIVAAIACALCFVIYLIDKNYYKRKQRHNTRELNKLVEQVNEVLEEEYPAEDAIEIYNTPVLETIDLTNENIEVPTIEQTPSNDAVEKMPENENIETLEIEELEEEKVENIVLEQIEELPVMELSYTDIEPNREQAQEELLRLTQELEKAEQEARNIELTAYEEEQEENAIISLEELVRKSKEMYASNEITQYEDEGNEPISLEDLERRMNKVKEEVAAIEEEMPLPVIIENIQEEPVITEIITDDPIIHQEQMKLDDFNTIKIDEPKIEPVKPAYQSVTKFKSSPIISPIYGIERREVSDSLELENTANYEKLDEEIKKTNEFLMTLRELQKNLD